MSTAFLQGSPGGVSVLVVVDIIVMAVSWVTARNLQPWHGAVQLISSHQHYLNDLPSTIYNKYLHSDVARKVEARYKLFTQFYKSL